MSLLMIVIIQTSIYSKNLKQNNHQTILSVFFPTHLDSHTNPRWDAFMSYADIYLCRHFCGYYCGIVISPWNDGIKALCVKLTEPGYQEIERLSMEAICQKKTVREHVFASIPFDISTEPCYVVDLRSYSEVTTQLTDFILSGNADDWNSSS